MAGILKQQKLLIRVFLSFFLSLPNNCTFLLPYILRIERQSFQGASMFLTQINLKCGDFFGKISNKSTSTASNYNQGTYNSVSFHTIHFSVSFFYPENIKTGYFPPTIIPCSSLFPWQFVPRFQQGRPAVCFQNLGQFLNMEEKCIWI